MQSSDDSNRIDILKEDIVKFAGVSKYTSFFEIDTDVETHVHVTIIDATNKSNHYSISKNRQNLVMIHGLGSSGLFFWRLFKTLSKDFIIYAIDIPGMGL